jgi:acyl carrier protein
MGIRSRAAGACGRAGQFVLRAVGPFGRGEGIMDAATEHRAVRREAILGALVNIFNRVCGVDPVEITPDRRIEELGIDSMQAADILAETETELDCDLDFRRIADDWSRLTVTQLVDEVERGLDGGASAEVSSS